MLDCTAMGPRPAFPLALCVVTSSVLASLGCGSPAIGEGQVSTVSVTFTTTASDPAVATAGEPAGGLVVSRAFLSASSLTLVPCDSKAAELVLPPRGYDLVSSLPPNEYVTTAVTDLCALRLDIDPLAQNATDGIPEGASIHIEGVDAAGTAFTLSSEQSLSFMLEAEADSSFGDLPLLLAFDVSTWLTAIPLTEDMTETATELLETQARGAVGLYVDADKNGTLDEAEQSAVALPKTTR
jgi:hypothetical protein